MAPSLPLDGFQKACSIGFFCVLFALGGTAFSQAPAPAEVKPTPNPAWAQWRFRPAANPDPALPRVLLIGDSILIGYLPEVTAQLKGKANVDAMTTPVNIGAEQKIRDLVRDALGHGPYAVVHFNDIGLHGYRQEVIPDEKYETLLRGYIDFIQANAKGASLIWAATTPITVKGAPTTLAPANATIVKRNAEAAAIVKEKHIVTDDLYELSAANLNRAVGDEYHWKKEGADLQGRQVAAAIEAALKARPAPAGK